MGGVFYSALIRSGWVPLAKRNMSTATIRCVYVCVHAITGLLIGLLSELVEDESLQYRKSIEWGCVLEYGA